MSEPDSYVLLMKSYLTALLSAFFVFGCSQQNAALNAVVAGTNVECNDGHFVLFVANRDGNSLEGIKITITSPDGMVTTLMADKGNLAKGEKPNCFKIKLYNGKTEDAKTHSTWQLSVFDLRPVNTSQP
jgi:PBP1b-binding outer membrane lipoprotein LpoB